MATRAIRSGQAARTEHASPRCVARPWWAWLFRFFPAAVVLAVSAVELALADRKYGLFSGGFGQSRAVDGPGEVMLFLAGYAAAQTLLGIAGWALALRLARGREAWTAWFAFCLITGALFCGVLAAQYRLHEYFSDAVGFALLAQLGGGSFVDALKFGASEIAVAVAALAAVTAGAWLLWRLLAAVLPAGLPRPAAPRARTWVIAAALVATAAFAIPRTGSDAAFGLRRMLAWQLTDGVLDRLSDVDRDGYGLFGIQHDEHPFDATRHPLALDIPGNGIDEDGYGGDLRLAELATPLGPQVFRGDRPNVVVVVFESTRGDVLGQRVRGKAGAPNL
jgi:hypothetical protein